MSNVALVIGATGATARRLSDHLAGDLGWKVYGACRSTPPVGTSFIHVAVDLMDSAAARAAFNGLHDVTHVYYAARAPHGEGGNESVPNNVDMLRNVLDAIEPVAKALKHVHLVEGGKWYGMHIGAYQTPAREDQPRHLPPNFYYDQQDLLSARASAGGWDWSASRPNVVCDFDPGRPRNLVPVLGAYAAICRAFDVPMDFPGTPAGFSTLTEVTDGTLLAHGIAHISTSEGGANCAVNVTNGDAFRWQTYWPVIAKRFGATPGIPRPFRLDVWMADKQEAWAEIARKHNLKEPQLDRVANWSFGDFVFGQDFDVISDTGRLRRLGFCESLDSEKMFLDLFTAYQDANLLP
ncbi:SDR family oxidoreductase [Lentibacter algarum]|uniref:SDR family oxidoreductase n=1 Tax=Lentibacter algarum TaxID=576131 RepID=UPI001C07DA2C|nr:SDR family oxidoreductase [Lentibacter algarum]MBU2980198.1 SDR family oxidoreductase [Lentibacter algarum]